MWAGRSLNSSRVLLLLILFTTGCRKHFEPVNPVLYDPAPTVHDVRGRRLRRLADIYAGKGEHRLVWRGRDDGGRRVPGGVYCVSLEVFDGTVHRTVMILR